MPRKTIKEKVEVEENKKTETVQVTENESVGKPEKKTKKSKKVETENKIEESENVTENETKTRKPRKPVNKESLEEEFQILIDLVEKEIEKLRENTKSKGIKILRSISKRLKTVKTHSLKLARNTRTSTRTNTNSGFTKPLLLSEKLTKFMGLKEGEMKSRTDVTKFVCNYIKEKDLQDPKDRRNILFQKDKKLSELLIFDNSEVPLTYYRLQTALKDHFLKSGSDSKETTVV
jgi:upstream activation factor subunit UAF30